MNRKRSVLSILRDMAHILHMIAWWADYRDSAETSAEYRHGEAMRKAWANLHTEVYAELHSAH